MPEKAQPVFLDYDQAPLDAAYNKAAVNKAAVPSRSRVLV
jgi:hypothetical protein